MQSKVILDSSGGKKKKKKTSAGRPKRIQNKIIHFLPPLVTILQKAQTI